MNLLPFAPDTLMSVIILIPLLGVLLVPLTGRSPNLRDGISLLLSAILFIAVVQLAMLEKAGIEPEVTLWHVTPFLSFTLSLEPLGMVFALIASSLWGLTTLYGIGYMRGNDEKNQTRFFTCFAFAICCAMGMALSGNLFTTFVFYEGMTLGTLPLVTHAGTSNAFKGGRTYLGLLMGTSLAFLLPAIIWTGVEAGTLDYIEGGILSSSGLSPWMTAFLLLLFAYGIGKAALMPFHRWLPAAMVAPTPVSALLHAVAVVKAGVFFMVKVVLYVFGMEHLNALTADSWFLHNWLELLAGATVIIASMVALAQDNLKRRLAYSTVSQLGYIVMAAAMLTPYGIVGAVTHIVAHAFGKITLFFAAGCIYTASGKTKVSELNGIGRKQPITMLAFAIASFSMIGLPPTIGFISKWYMMKGAFLSSHYEVFVILAVSTLMNCFYLLPIVYQAFFLNPDDAPRTQNVKVPVKEAPWPMLVAISVTSLTCIILFLFPDWVVDVAFALLHAATLRY